MTVRVDIEEQRGQFEAYLYKLLERISDAVAIAHELTLIKICVPRDLRVSLPEELVRQFHARVVAQAPESLILEATGTPEQIDVLVEILRPCVILKMVRTGRVTTAARPRATLEERRNATDSYAEIPEGAD